MRFIIKATLVVVLLHFIFSCSENEKNQSSEKSSPPNSDEQVQKIQSNNSGPEKVLIAYLHAELSASMNGRSKETYNFLSKKDKEVISEKEYLSTSVSDEPNISPELLAAMKQKIKYQIKSSAI